MPHSTNISTRERSFRVKLDRFIVQAACRCIYSQKPSEESISPTQDDSHIEDLGISSAEDEFELLDAVTPELSAKERFPEAPAGVIEALDSFVTHELPSLAAVTREIYGESKRKAARELRRLTEVQSGMERLKREQQKSLAHKEELRRRLRKLKKAAITHRVKTIVWVALGIGISLSDAGLVALTLIARSAESGVSITLSSWAVGIAAMVLLGLCVEFSLLRPFYTRENNEEGSKSDTGLAIAAGVVLLLLSVGLALLRGDALGNGDVTDIALIALMALVLSGIALAAAWCFRIAHVHDRDRGGVLGDIEERQFQLDQLQAGEAELQALEEEATDLEPRVREASTHAEEVARQGGQSVIRQPAVQRFIADIAAQMARHAVEQELPLPPRPETPNVRMPDGDGDEAVRARAHPLSQVGRNGDASSLRLRSRTTDAGPAAEGDS